MKTIALLSSIVLFGISNVYAEETKKDVPPVAPPVQAAPLTIEQAYLLGWNDANECYSDKSKKDNVLNCYQEAIRKRFNIK